MISRPKRGKEREFTDKGKRLNDSHSDPYFAKTVFHALSSIAPQSSQAHVSGPLRPGQL